MRAIFRIVLLFAVLFALGVASVSAGWQLSVCAHHVVYLSAEDSDPTQPGDQPGWLEIGTQVIKNSNPANYPESEGTLPNHDTNEHPYGFRLVLEDSSRHIEWWHDMEIDICEPGRDKAASAAFNGANAAAAAPAAMPASDSAAAGLAICTSHQAGAWIRSLPGIDAPKVGSLERGDRITNLVHGFVAADSVQRWHWAQFIYQGSPAYVAKTASTDYC